MRTLLIARGWFAAVTARSCHRRSGGSSWRSRGSTRTRTKASRAAGTPARRRSFTRRLSCSSTSARSNPEVKARLALQTDNPVPLSLLALPSEGASAAEPSVRPASKLGQAGSGEGGSYLPLLPRLGNGADLAHQAQLILFGP